MEHKGAEYPTIAGVGNAGPTQHKPVQERLQAIANEVAAILPRLTGDPKACFLDWLNGGTGTRDTNWHDSKKVVELREERRALLDQYKLRVVE